MPYLVEFFFILVGFVLLVVGADKLVEAASNIAVLFGMPERVIGLTIVALGTSLPELVVSVTSGVAGHADMVFGNVVGSCLANILLILGISSLIAPIPLARSTRRFEIPASIASVAVLLVFANTGGSISFFEGVAMLVLFAAFMIRSAMVGMRAKRSVDLEDVEPLESSVEVQPAAHEEKASAAQKSNILFDVFVIAVSVVLLKFGADFVVDNAVVVASGLGVSERVVGITVVALGTCLPELVTGAVAALKGNTEIAVGNVIGSNVANVLLVVGAPALFSSVAYDTVYNFDFVLLMVFTTALLLCALRHPRNRMTRIDGIVFTLLYVAYIVASMLR